VTAPRRAKRKPARQDREGSSSMIAIPGGRTSGSGLGVAVQFSIATAGAIAASLVVFGVILYSILSGILSAEIDEAGVQSVRSLAIVDAKCWLPFHETALEGREDEAQTGGLKVELPADQKTQYERRSALNRQRLRGLVEARGTKLLDAVVLDREMKKVLSGAGPISFEPRGAPRSIGEVSIQRGIYVAASSRTQARTYTADVKDQDGSVSARVIVALSEEKIEKSLKRVLTSLVLLTLVFLGLGILASWLVAQRVTRPIHQLSEDIEAVAGGDLDHRTHAHSSDEIGVLARTFDRMTQNVRSFQDVQKKQAAQEHQIEVAREVQSALLPEKLPDVPGYACAAASRPAAKVAGDFYDVSEMGGGAKLLAVVSASGSGVPGAMVVTMVRSLLKVLASGETSPAALLRRVNHFLAPDLRRGMYVSALLVRVEPGSDRLFVANAGHHPLLVCKRGGAKADPFHSDGIALGFDKGPIFDRTIKDRELTLAAGERVLLCTRSLFAIKDSAGRELGEESVYQLFQRESARPSGEFVAFALSALEKFRAGADATEDITFLTLQRLG